ncbi:MAG: tRNA threonylcarbamoyladenosine dehydratase [Kiritimatiellae bacterium]|nr:tRNA threonylcarbamoyladenosine dehydratase [Kiritimatiellia bacterium]
MDENPFSRTERLIGTDAQERLKQARVAVFGVGGVGSYCVEALARAGIGHLLLVDADVISISNLNRQLPALHSTLGQPKVDVMAARIRDINPEAAVEARRCFYLPENAADFDLGHYDFVVDAVDTVAAKVELAVQANRCGVPIISCMGAGNKLDPTRFEVSDLFSTSVCPLCKAMRKQLKARGIDRLTVVYSKESPRTPIETAPDAEPPARKVAPGSISFVPSVAGLILAGHVIRQLAGNSSVEG